MNLGIFMTAIGAKPPNLACGPAADIIRMSSLRYCMFRLNESLPRRLLEEGRDG
jgi:hypothetical protein